MHTNDRILQSHKSCGGCSKKLVKHKKSPTCYACSRNFHPSCVNLTPSDINLLISTNLLNTWICKFCSSNIFPNHVDFEGHQTIDKIDSLKHGKKTAKLVKHATS